MEMTAVIKNVRWGMSACVASLALALSGGLVNAQQKAPDAPAKADVKKVEPPKADAKKAEPAKKAEVKKAEPKKPPSACAGIEEPACLANAECMWVKEVVTKAGQKRKAHCQKKPTPPKPKGEAKKAEPAKAAAPAPAAKTAPAPAAPAAKAAPAAPAAPAPAKK